ncbi:hypothetical protein CEXT_591641 [Caerostris extrusa]|uniref:Uncharacterized protein n=1 Tax=Caerostris extrusa TaxID=172846 RepID=A0AAV4WIH1_CAEEX|nr:hypothetical protein CEXT_591641 [Caerostris extrusa]
MCVARWGDAGLLSPWPLSVERVVVGLNGALILLGTGRLRGVLDRDHAVLIAAAIIPVPRFVLIYSLLPRSTSGTREGIPWHCGCLGL